MEIDLFFLEFQSAVSSSHSLKPTVTAEMDGIIHLKHARVGSSKHDRA
jgi:hypothetical protein